MPNAVMTLVIEPNWETDCTVTGVPPVEVGQPEALPVHDLTVDSDPHGKSGDAPLVDLGD